MGSSRWVRHSIVRALAVGAGVAVGAYGLTVFAAWLRFGRPRQSTGQEQDPLLNRFMPDYHIVERHQVPVEASPEATFAAACDLDLQQSRLIAAIFKARERVLGSSPDGLYRPRAFVPQAKALGWGVLAEIPGREIVMGAVTRPWEADVVFRALPPDQFASFDEPGYVKIVWTLRADPARDGGSIFRTETRATATDAGARRRFRRYWAFFSPGIILIRREALHQVKAEAERRIHERRAVMPDDRFDLVSSSDLDPQC
jgi:hypothetical protein